MIYDFDGTFLGKSGTITPLDFWIANSPQCKNIYGDVYTCPSRNMGILSFESIAADFVTKTLSPIYLREVSSNEQFDCTLMEYQPNEGHIKVFNRFASNIRVN